MYDKSCVSAKHGVIGLTFLVAMLVSMFFALPQQAYAGSEGASFSVPSISYNKLSEVDQKATIDLQLDHNTNLQSSMKLISNSPDTTFYVYAELILGSVDATQAKTFNAPVLKLNDADFNEINTAACWPAGSPAQTLTRVHGYLKGDGFISIYCNRDDSEYGTYDIPSCQLRVWIMRSEIGDCYDNNHNANVETYGWHNYKVTYSGYFTNPMRTPDSVDVVMNGKVVKTVKLRNYPMPKNSYLGGTPTDLNISYTNTAAKPGTTYKAVIVAHRYGCADEILSESGSWAKTAPFGKATIKATKISANSAFVTASLADIGSTTTGETSLKFYMGSKLVKTVKTTSGKYSYKITVNKKGAGKAKFKVVCVPNVKGVSVSKTTSSTTKPKANSYKTTYSKNAKSYYGVKLYMRVGKASVSGKKVSVSGHWINSHILTLKKGKFKITVTYNGKKMGSKTLSTSGMSGNSIRSFSTSIKTKKPVDLRDPLTRIELTKLADVV